MYMAGVFPCYSGGLAGLTGRESPDNYYFKSNVAAHCLKLEIWCTYVCTNEGVLWILWKLEFVNSVASCRITCWKLGSRSPLRGTVRPLGTTSPHGIKPLRIASSKFSADPFRLDEKMSRQPEQAAIPSKLEEALSVWQSVPLCRWKMTEAFGFVH